MKKRGKWVAIFISVTNSLPGVLRGQTMTVIRSDKKMVKNTQIYQKVYMDLYFNHLSYSSVVPWATYINQSVWSSQLVRQFRTKHLELEIWVS